MAIPNTPLWATDTITDTVVVQGTSVTYQNKIQPPAEIRSSGVLANTPITLGHLNYQFSSINTNIDYLKSKVTTVQHLISGNVYNIDQTHDGKYLRVNNASSVALNLNYGVCELGTKIMVRQAGVGVATAIAGLNVTITTETGFLPKTSGINTTITLIKVSDTGTSEIWDAYGDLGV